MIVSSGDSSSNSDSDSCNSDSNSSSDRRGGGVFFGDVNSI